MGLMSVEKFLCCFPLEIGGYVNGIITAILATLSVVANLILFFSGIFETNPPVWWVLLIINIIYSSLLLYASVMLISGTRNSNPDSMRLYLIFMIIGVVLAFLQILLFTGWIPIAVAIIWALIVFYFFVCIYSLFKEVGGTSIIC